MTRFEMTAIITFLAAAQLIGLYALGALSYWSISGTLLAPIIISLVYPTKESRND